MKHSKHALSALTLPLMLTACAQSNATATAEGRYSEPIPPHIDDAPGPKYAFWKALSSHCGKAYKGQLTSTDEADANMQGAEMIIHFRTCDGQGLTQITVPFHIKKKGGEWDRSRTWVFTRMRLDRDIDIDFKHDHRHKDGSSDAVTMYGGHAAYLDVDRSNETRQSFPVDSTSIAMFKREGLDASVTNIWSVSVDPAGTPNGKFIYQLTRTKAGGAPADRNFTVTFDLTKPVKAPPPPWGSET